MTPGAAPDFELEHALAALERTPAALGSWLEGLPDAWVRSNEGGDTWSPYDVVAHLVHAERVNWLPRARHILAGAAGPFAAFDRTGFRDGRERTLSAHLAEFAELRAASVSEVRDMRLTKDDLARTGIHPELGEVRLEQLLATWVVHDLGHVRQVARTMAKRHARAVGPWRAYLSILGER